MKKGAVEERGGLDGGVGPGAGKADARRGGRHREDPAAAPRPGGGGVVEKDVGISASRSLWKTQHDGRVCCHCLPRGGCLKTSIDRSIYFHEQHPTTTLTHGF